MFRLWWKSKTIRTGIAPVADLEEPETPHVLVAVTVSKPNTGTRIGPTEIGGKRVIVTCVRSALKEHPMVRGPLNGPLALAFVVFTRKAPVKVASRGREFGAETFMRLPFWSTMLSSVFLTMLPGVCFLSHCPGSLFVRFALPL